METNRYIRHQMVTKRVQKGGQRYDKEISNASFYNFDAYIYIYVVERITKYVLITLLTAMCKRLRCTQ